jgi:hypothetical protein
MPRRTGHTKTVTISVSPLLHAELSAEAWESEMSLTEYVRTLLSSRGKWARMTGKPGGYLIGELAKPKRSVR